MWIKNVLYFLSPLFFLQKELQFLKHFFGLGINIIQVVDGYFFLFARYFHAFFGDIVQGNQTT